MRNSTLPTALERLIEPLPNDLKAAVLEAWKNEDIPHDENDSVYRLMVLLTLYARFYQDIATSISAAASKIGQIHDTHLTEVRTTYAKQAEQNRELLEDLKYIDERFTDLRKVMDEKPKSLRTQFEGELESLCYKLRTEGQKTISEFSSYTSRFKNDCEEWRVQAYFTYLLVGVIAGIGITLIILALIYHG
jgi:hypothetical protein